jgi:predicted dehydrogenase
MYNICVIGLGYWGPNLVRNFLSHPDIDNVFVFDKNKDRVKLIKKNFPPVIVADNYKDLVVDKNIHAAAIATPVDSHYKLSKDFLQSGKHIWVEKPFTSSSEQGIELIELANKNNLNIFVDHTFIYNGAVRKIKEIIDNNELGEIIYFDSVRINLGLFQHDINVLWDLAPHDLSIMNYALGYNTTSVSANGIANFYGLENLAHLCVYFSENCFAHFHVNWTSPVKIRTMIIGGKKKMLVYNDMENIEKIKVYDCGVSMDSKESIYETLIQYRTGDMHSPKIDSTEALSFATAEFINSIKEKRQPLTNGNEGLKVVKILEAAERSIKNKGKLIEIF